MAGKYQSGVSNAVYRYFQAHRNLEVHISDVMADTNLSHRQVSSAVSHLRSKSGITIDSPRKGWYIFRGGAANGSREIVPHKAKAEVLALLDDGQVVLTIEGSLYIAAELEVE